jgi:hypothetical protein
MAEKYVRGITSLKIGDILPSGGMATTLASIGTVFEGTATLETAEATVNKFFGEQSDDPIDQSETPGETTLKFNLVDVTPAAMLAVLGGTVVTTTWKAPASAPSIEKSIEVITRTGIHIEITRAKIVARLSMALGKASMGQIAVVATKLVPSLSGDDGLRVFS